MNPMKTICLLESVSRLDGGIFEAECALQRHLLMEEGVQVQVIGLEDQFSRDDAPLWKPLVPLTLPVTGPRALGYSPGFAKAFDPKADLFYAATLWRYPSLAALRWREKTNKPMIVAPHGSLDEWALQHSYWRKRLASLLFKDRQLHAASCLRALSHAEAKSFRDYGLKNPICVIPNGVELPEEAEKPETGNLKPENGKKTLLFLGRLHPKKGLLNAIRAFAKALDSRPSTFDSASWQFIIAGWGQGGHEAELKKLCEELGLRVERRRSKVEGQASAADVVFWGPAFGEEKKRLLRNADAFILPSLSEGLPMAVLEAWAHGLPVVMTPECHLPEGFYHEAAVRINAESRSIARGLAELFSMTEADRCAMGGRGRQLVQQSFSWKVLARQMREVYDWVLGGGIEPECVIR